MTKKCQIQNYDFPLFEHKLGNDTFKICLNGTKYNCGVGKNHLLKFEKFYKFFEAASLVFFSPYSQISVQIQLL